MAEYKDAKAIKAQIREVCRDCWTIQRVGGCAKHCGINEAIKAVDAVPPADAVPVVRCGECIFWDRCHVSCEGLAKCLTGEGGIRYRNRSDFCSKGRKREGDNHD